MSRPLYDVELSYGENAAEGPVAPPSPVPQHVLGTEAGWQLFGIPVGYPIGVPASPLTTNSHWIGICASQGFNILTYKTVRNRATPTPALPPPNWLFVQGLIKPLQVGRLLDEVRADLKRTHANGSRAYSMINSCGIPSTVATDWQIDIKRASALLRPGQMLIVSVVGDYESLSGQALVDDFVTVACLAEDAGAVVIELNLSCPNSVSTRGGGLKPLICTSAEDTRRIVLAVRGALDPGTKLVAKLGYLGRDVLEGVMSAIVAAVDGIAGINTLPVPVQDEKSGPVFLGTLADPREARRKAGLSGIAIRDYALDFVRSLALLRRKHGWEFEIVGMGGVMEPHDVRALMANGADAVQSATAASNNPELPRQLCNDGHPLPSEDERLVRLIAAALSDQRWEFRTTESLADELRLEVQHLARLIESHPEVARQSVLSDRKGQQLYSARNRPPSVRERVEQLRWMLAR